MKNYLLIPALAALALCSKVATAQPIINIPSGIGMYMAPGTAINLDGLVLSATSAFVLTGGISKKTNVSHASNVPYIQQVYKMDNTINNFSGTVSILYGGAAMNNINEKNLGLYINDGVSWDFYNSNSSQDISKKILSSQLANIDLNEITLAESLVILPLQLLSFTAVMANQHAQLQWQTTNETNTSYFQIERSTNGQYFRGIGQVNALNIAGNHRYYFTDSLTPQSIVYYRIKLFDQNGRFATTQIIRLNNLATENLIAYPNPFLQQLTVSASKATTISVWSLDGKILFTKQLLAGNNVLNMEAFAAGVYIIQYKNGESIRVVKQ